MTAFVGGAKEKGKSNRKDKSKGNRKDKKQRQPQRQKQRQPQVLRLPSVAQDDSFFSGTSVSDTDLADTDVSDTDVADTDVADTDVSYIQGREAALAEEGYGEVVDYEGCAPG
jgi:hypothetical protein